MKSSSIRFIYVKDNQVSYKLQISRRDFFDFMNLPYDQPDRDWIAERCVWQPIVHVELSEG